MISGDDRFKSLMEQYQSLSKRIPVIINDAIEKEREECARIVELTQIQELDPPDYYACDDAEKTLKLAALNIRYKGL